METKVAVDLTADDLGRDIEKSVDDTTQNTSSEIVVGSVEPTEDELATLQRVADSIPTGSWLVAAVEVDLIQNRQTKGSVQRKVWV